LCEKYTLSCLGKKLKKISNDDVHNDDKLTVALKTTTLKYSKIGYSDGKIIGCCVFEKL